MSTTTKLRQTMTVTATIEVEAEPWDEIKYPGWMSRDPGTGEVEGEPPITFREDLESELWHALRRGRGHDGDRSIFVYKVSVRPDGEPFNPTKEPVYGPDEEPF